MKKVFLAVFVLCFVTFAAKKTEVVKIVKSDTTKTVKCDTVLVVKNDTLRITKLYEDTSYLLKSDTLKIPGASKEAVKGKK